MESGSRMLRLYVPTRTKSSAPRFVRSTSLFSASGRWIPRHILPRSSQSRASRPGSASQQTPLPEHGPCFQAVRLRGRRECLGRRLWGERVGYRLEVPPLGFLPAVEVRVGDLLGQQPVDESLRPPRNRRGSGTCTPSAGHHLLGVHHEPHGARSRCGQDLLENGLVEPCPAANTLSSGRGGRDRVRLASGRTSFAARRWIGKIFSTYQLIWSGRLQLSVSPVGHVDDERVVGGLLMVPAHAVSRPKSSSSTGSSASSSAAREFAPSRLEHGGHVRLSPPSSPPAWPCNPPPGPHPGDISLGSGRLRVEGVAGECAGWFMTSTLFPERAAMRAVAAATLLADAALARGSSSRAKRGRVRDERGRHGGRENRDQAEVGECHEHAMLGSTLWYSLPCPPAPPQLGGKKSDDDEDRVRAHENKAPRPRPRQHPQNQEARLRPIHHPDMGGRLNRLRKETDVGEPQEQRLARGLVNTPRRGPRANPGPARRGQRDTARHLWASASIATKAPRNGMNIRAEAGIPSRLSCITWPISWTQIRATTPPQTTAGTQRVSSDPDPPSSTWYRETLPSTPEAQGP